MDDRRINKQLRAVGVSIRKLRNDFERDFKDFPDSKVVAHRIAVITSKGPGNESDFAGENFYWLKFQRAKIASDGTVTLVDETAPGLGGIVAAVSLGEAATSHSLATDDTVYVDARLVDHRTTPPLRRWYFNGGTLPIGEFDGMTYGMVSDNEAGFSFQRICNVPPGF